MPWYTRVLAIAVVAYAFSPVDLVPDFVPVLGMLDDMVIVPAGIALVFRMLPRAVLEEARQRAQTVSARPTHWGGVVLVVSIWLLVVAFTITLLSRLVDF